MRQVEERYLELDRQKIEEDRISRELGAVRYSEYRESLRRNILEMAVAISFKLESYNAEEHCWVLLDKEPYVSWIIFESDRNSESKRNDVHLLSDGRFVVWDNKEEVREAVKGFNGKLRVVKELNLDTNLKALDLVLDNSIEHFQHMLLCVAKDTFNINPKKEWYSLNYPPPNNKKSHLRMLFENFKSRFA